MKRLNTLFALGASLLSCASAMAAEPLPQRWISSGGSLSEWGGALGGGSRLGGVDSTSQHPESLRALPSIGYQRQLAAEGMLTLRPDMLIGSEEMGPPPVLAQLRGWGVRGVSAPPPPAPRPRGGGPTTRRSALRGLPTALAAAGRLAGDRAASTG